MLTMEASACGSEAAADWEGDIGSAVDAQTMQPSLGLYPGRGPSVAEETREYQPPEASLGGLPYDAADPRSYDLWSVGIMLLELLLATPHVLPLSQRAEAKLRLRFPRQPAEVVERLRLANALAEYCIAPAAVVNVPQDRLQVLELQAAEKVPRERAKLLERTTVLNHARLP